MKRNTLLLYLLCLHGMIVLVACGPSEPAAVSTSDTTAQPTAVALPSVTPAEEPLSTATEQASATPTEEVPTITPTEPPATPTPEPSLDEEPHATLGSPDAPITIYEFSDFGCPACRQYALFTFPTLKEEYIDTGKVLYIYKDYPIVSQQGALAAQAAECAGEQDAYWEMHDQLFRNPEEWNTTPEEALAVFRRYAAAHGMDADALAACVEEGRYQEDIDRDFEEAMEIGWFGTPTFIINRKLLSGAQPPEVFREVLERELSAEGSGTE